MREAFIERQTAETRISLRLNLDGEGKSQLESPCPFLNHMLCLLAKHALFDLDLNCEGDIEVDGHHSVEDIGICLGKALVEAAGDKRGICRYGSMILPMDEALILAAVDFSGRSQLEFGLEIPAAKVGDFDTELVEEFFTALVRTSGLCLHLKQLSGRNSHHIIEGAFKATARSLRQALSIDERAASAIPSSKGVL